MLENNFILKMRECFSRNSLSEYLNAETEEKLYNLYEILVEYNKKVNLTAITDEDGVILKHFADSITLAKHIPASASVVDIGCGGGFPSLPLVIVRSDVKISGIDSVAKKTVFVNYAAQQLGLKNVTAMAARAEDVAKDPKYREKFDVSCARAVSKLNVIAELCIPFLKNGGSFLAMKADDTEIELAKNALDTLNTSVEFRDTFVLSAQNGEEMNRCIIGMRKNGKISDKYPRNYSAIVKSPL